MEFREISTIFTALMKTTSVFRQPVLVWVCLFLTDPCGGYGYMVH